jgi:hypothetical protein
MMQQWEYVFIVCESGSESAQTTEAEELADLYAHFVELGQHGWECVALLREYAIFKRPVLAAHRPKSASLLPLVRASMPR